MKVGDAIAARFSAREFLPDPVSGETVRALLEAAQRAPSGGNIQPWEVVALTGQPLADLILEVSGHIAAGRQEVMRFGIYPDPLEDPYRARRRECGLGLYSALGVTREDKAGRARQHARNFDLFGAPVGLFFVIDTAMGPPQWADLGMFMQTVMLLAEEAGLGTCAQAAWAQWPDTVSRHLSLPPDRLVFSGMAMGVVDHAAPVNRWRTKRAPFQSVVQMRGF